MTARTPAQYLSERKRLAKRDIRVNSNLQKTLVIHTCNNIFRFLSIILSRLRTRTIDTHNTLERNNPRDTATLPRKPRWFSGVNHCKTAQVICLEAWHLNESSVVALPTSKTFARLPCRSLNASTPVITSLESSIYHPHSPCRHRNSPSLLSL
jgi:hypothetical protein